MREKAALAWLSCLSTGLICLAISGPSLAEKIGQVSQPLVAGKEVSAQEQKDQTLVGVSIKGAVCSGALLNNEWAITAAHCFTGRNATPADLTVNANWPTAQSKKVKAFHLLDNDLAIVRVDTPFAGMTDFSMPVYTGAVQPGRAVKVYGQGIYQLATGSGASATPSKSDGKYRSGEFQVGRVDNMRFWFGPGKDGVIPAGGDSGGPAFLNAGGRWFLAGISSLCLKFSVKDKPQDTWTWVNQVTECGYAPLAAVWPQIQRLVGSAQCRNYAWRAVGAAEMTKYYGCDPKLVSGPRWSPNFDDHLNYCMGAKAADANFEDKERIRLMHECRIAAAMPQGTSALTVAESADGFKLSGSGYAVNARVIIRATDSAGEQNNITSNFADAKGNFAATVDGSRVCTKSGKIVFTAEDQDKPPSPPVTATCKAAAPAPAPAPPPAPKDEAAAPPEEQAAADPAPAAPPPAEQTAPPRNGKSINVKLSVDLYDTPGGNGRKTGMLRAGTKKVTLLEPCNDNWCHVQWPAGEGWVYSGPGYKSLKLP